MFKHLRIAILLYVLLFVAVGQLVTAITTTNWEHPLWVEVHPINGDSSPQTQTYIERLEENDFDAVEEFFSREAQRFGLELEQPVRVLLAPRYEGNLPELSAGASAIDMLIWSLKMRWLATRLSWQSDRPRPDARLFAVYHDSKEANVLERSGALRKGLIAVANVFADRSARGSNQVIFAHELLHTLGANDKYNPKDNTPLFPIGFADPNAKPLYPQRRAEIMAGRIPVGPLDAAMPASLKQVIVGPATAAEIRWRDLR